MTQVTRRMFTVAAGFGLLICGVAGATQAAPEGSHVYQHAAVAADHRVASEAGAEMLRQGGNAVDAAVATSFALSVVRPMSCGIGGGGFMVIYNPDAPEGEPKAIALNYREISAVGKDYYVKLDREDASRFGVHAPGVPGTVAGLLYALEHYGTLDRAAVLAPAIRAASEGWAVGASHVSVVRTLAERRAKDPMIRTTSQYLWEHLCLNGDVKVGDVVRSPDQAKTLRLIAAHGADVFYRGEIADAITGLMKEYGGPITREDLAGYRPRVVEPLVCEFRGRTVFSMPPPSSGGIVMQQVFGVLQRRLGEIEDLGPYNPAYLHLLTEAFKHAFADRAEWLADSAFVDVPIDRLTGETYLDDLARRVDPDHTLKKFDYGSVAPMPDDGGTSHHSTIDARGMAVACTETINLTFGSMVVVPGYGFALNNEMDDFTTIPGQPNAFGLRQSDRNLPEPGKRPLSSMSPTIVVNQGKVELIGGAAGGPRIITATTQALLNCLLFDMSAGEALNSPRLHHQWMPEHLVLEDRWDHQASMSGLEARGHILNRGSTVGTAQLIRVTTRGVEAASDPRRGGAPAGY